MKHALALPNAGPIGDPQSLANLARLAEDSGWDAVLLEDYIVHAIAPGQLPVYDPWICLAAMAIATTRIRLGTLVTALPRRRPWKVAREALTLDHLSAGRMILGVGLGDANLDWSFTKFGEPTDLRARAELTDEALEIITGLWSGLPFERDGRHFRVREVTFVPTPVQKPRIPIWIGGIWPRKGAAFERAFRYDGFAGYRGRVGTAEHGPLTAGDVAQIKQVSIARKGNSAFDIVVGGFPRGDDLDLERERRKQCARAGATWWQEYLIGPPDQVRELIKSGPLRSF